MSEKLRHEQEITDNEVTIALRHRNTIFVIIIGTYAGKALKVIYEVSGTCSPRNLLY